MKINANYVLHQVMDYYFIMGVGKDAYTPNQIMTLNETGAFLWRLLEAESGASQEDLVNALINEYEVNAETAAADVEIFLNDLRARSMIIE